MLHQSGIISLRSTIAEHAWQAGHEIEWDNVEILDTATDLQERKIKEAVYIRLAPKGLKMNRDEERSSYPFGSGPSRKLRTSRCTSHTPRENRGQETTGHRSELDDRLLPLHQLHDDRLHPKDHH